jgi:N12 class adenine-specific DNA methylase
MLDLFDAPNQEPARALSATTVGAASNASRSSRELANGWKARANDNITAIAITQSLAAEKRLATDEERRALSKFIGFGASDLANGMFRGPGGGFRPGWEDLGLKLEATVSAEELAGLARATQYAFYTPEPMVEAIWSAVRHLGFHSGRVLEPGCGTGLFMGLAPQSVSQASFIGVEAESVSASIAAAIYPDATIIRDNFLGLKLEPEFDLAIGNPPFSSRRCRVKQGKEQSGKLGLLLHDFFIARALELLRPGGLAAFITSHGTLDKLDRKARTYMAALADLIAAVRLPAGAMQATAGTEVVADILFLRRRHDAEPVSGPRWRDVVDIDEFGDDTLRVNEYFVANPQNVLGTHAWARTLYAPGYTCNAIAGEMLDEQLQTFVASLPENIVRIGVPATPHLEPASVIASPTHHSDLKEGSFGVDSDGSIFQVIDGHKTPVPIRSKTQPGIHGKHARIIRGFVAMRSALRSTLREQRGGNMGEAQQAELAAAYEAFVLEFGPINRTTITEVVNAEGESSELHRRPNLQPVLADPDAWLVASIELYDAETNSAKRGPIFTQQVVHPPAPRQIDGVDGALAVTLDEKGRVDIDYIAGLLAVERDAAIEQLGPRVYLVPETDGLWQTADEYLSGTVREKLSKAQEAQKLDSRFERNVNALLEAQPKDLNPSDVSARLGASWIPPSDIERFISEAIGIDTRVSHCAEVASWDIDDSPFHHRSMTATSVWGTARRHAGRLLHDALNGVMPQIYDTIKNENGNDTRVLNVVDTEAAKEKLDKIKRAFESWIWTDEERTNRLMYVYNTIFNDIVPRRFDGSHLRLPGASSVFTFYPHQKRVIWRCISAGNTYIAHSVGAGKTLCIAASIMEQRRLGLISKAMLVVPGHCLAQASRDFLQLYPNASILVADESNFVKAKRHRFIAQATLGAWDCIIITHSAFQFIPTPSHFEQTMIDEEISLLNSLLDVTETSMRTTRKRLELRKEQLSNRLDNLRTRKDDMVTLAEMGIDHLVVDEAQFFRKLEIQTRMDTLKGVDTRGSMRAWDLYVKSRYIATVRPGRSLTLSSGTPVTNTLGELFTVQRFMDLEGLRRRSIDEFDAWAAAFGDTRTELELQPNGKYTPVTRFAEFVNVPELIGMFRMFADVLIKDDLRSLLTLPRVAGGSRQLMTAPASDQFKEYQKALDGRITAIKERQRQSVEGDDILLSVITDGRHAAIDVRLVGYREDDSSNKLNLLIDNALRIYRETSTLVYSTRGVPDERPGAGQLIFSDLGTMNALDKRGFSAYAWIRKRLIAAGVPKSEIAFMQDYKRSIEKQALFNRFNAGLVRILLGSSETMGTGVNVQKRLKALHHLDVPWLPAQIEQREGRIERQGNQNDEIEIYAYATLTSMDSQMWQANARKQRFIDALMKGDTSIRRIEDPGSEANQFALAKAIASGDPLLLQKAGLDVELARLRRLRAAHFDDQHLARRRVFAASATIAEATARRGALTNALAKRIPTRGDAFRMVVGDRVYTSRKAAGEAILRAAFDVDGDRFQPVGEIGGFIVLAKQPRHRESSDFVQIDLCGLVLGLDLWDKPTASGVVSRLENRVADIEELIARAENNITFADRELNESERSRTSLGRAAANSRR